MPINGNLKLIRALPNESFQCHDFKGITIVTTLRLDQSNLCERKFKHLSKMA